MQLRAWSGSGQVQVVPRSTPSRCSVPAIVALGDDWLPVELEVAASGPEYDELEGLTIRAESGPLSLMVDAIRFD